MKDLAAWLRRVCCVIFFPVPRHRRRVQAEISLIAVFEFLRNMRRLGSSLWSVIFFESGLVDEPDRPAGDGLADASSFFDCPAMRVTKGASLDVVL